MIKQYFTDGLIGLAILLSLFRTDLDLVNINNLINYPEVQDIIQGQTAAYLPANFHHLSNLPHVFGNRKHVDFDSEAFTAWYNRFQVNNLLRYRRGQQNDIEAFLVSGSTIISNHLQEIQASTEHTAESNDSPPVSSPTLPEESASSYPELSASNTTSSSSSGTTDETNNSTTPTEQTSVVIDVSLVFNNPFPGCNLTTEDLELIDVLWRQDEDLGVGKEVYDANLRLELEKKQELEQFRLQEMQKAQRLAKEKQEREKQEQASRWLKENFWRDGETGEWVCLQNDFSAPLPQPESGNDEFPTLESALDYIFDVGTDILARSSTAPQTVEAPVEQFPPPLEQPPEQQPVAVERQDSLEESWNGLVNYLNLAENVDDPTTAPATGGYHDVLLEADDNNNKETEVAGLSTNSSMYQPLSGVDVVDQQSSAFVLHNVSMPADSMNMSDELISLASANEMSAVATTSNLTSQPSPSSNLTGAAAFDLDNLNLFEGLAGLEGAEAEDFDLAEIDDMFRTIQSSGGDLLEPIMSMGESMDTLQKLGEEVNQSMASVGSASSFEDFDALEGLEGAIGGSDDFNLSESTDLTSLKNARGCRPKVQRFSESSNDSGFAYKNGFSSNSSNESSYGGSPAGSSHGTDSHLNFYQQGSISGHVTRLHNGSTSDNGTEHDPRGSRTLAQHQVAHNHTYNTPPGQVPREVKKYAHKEPSRKGPQSRDQRRAMELKIPFSLDEIIESPVETFNEMLNAHKLTEPQLTLIRDIRRRGKNKVAAQNCRKRKVNVIVNLSDERSDLEKTRDRLLAERAEMEQEARRMRAKFGQLYAHIFQSLRDEQGQPYDPSHYSLQQSSDGNVFLVPHNMSAGATSHSASGQGLVSLVGTGSAGSSSAASSASSSPSTTSSAPSAASKGSLSASKKRKAFHE